jgi:hypothetical protein
MRANEFIVEAEQQQNYTFGMPLSHLKSPKGGKPAYYFKTSLGSQYVMTTDGMALRYKSAGHDKEFSPGQGLQTWSDKIMFIKDQWFARMLKDFIVGTSSVRTKLRGTSLKIVNGKAIIGLCLDQWYDARYKYWDHQAPVKDPMEVITTDASTNPITGYYPIDFDVGSSGEIHSFHPGNQVADIMRLTS